jgi:hypothetical protein
MRSPDWFGKQLSGLGDPQATAMDTWDRYKSQILGQLRDLQGMGVRGMDTPAELDFYLAQLGSVRLHPMTNLALIDALERTYGGAIDPTNKDKKIYTLDKMFTPEAVAQIRSGAYNRVIEETGALNSEYANSDFIRTLRTGNVHLPPPRVGGAGTQQGLPSEWSIRLRGQ